MVTSETRNCQNCKNQFVIEPDDFGFYEKMNAPPPTWCPECRMLRRFMFYNQRHLFRRKENYGGKEIFAGFPAAVPAKIYEIDFWNSDGWEPTEYGRDYDFSKPFFEQFRELLYATPWPSRDVLSLVNSDYCNNTGWSKNCYLGFDMGDSENAAYAVRANEVKDSLDLYEARHTELSYEGYMIDEAYRVFFSVNCEECQDVWFSKDMLGCSNCFGCVGLRNKSHYIFNKPCSKEEYKKYFSQFDSGSHATIAELKKRAQEFWKKFPVKFALAIRVVNSTGEHIEKSKNLKYCYSVHEAENLGYSQFIEPSATDSYDYTEFGGGASLIYESLDCGIESYRVKFSLMCWSGCRELEYSAFCRSALNCFGCVGLKKKQYCILNKQYTEDEYFSLREKIVKQMDEMPYTDSKGRIYKYGEFFPPEFSPFAYNETMAQDFFPLTESEAKEKGIPWRERERREYDATVNASGLPDNIKDVGDSILKEIVKCDSCGRAYRIIQLELQFYRRIGLPLPRLCHNCRFNERFKFANPPKWRPAKCQCAGTADDREIYKNEVKHSHDAAHCPNEFETSYPLSRPEIIYCEQCYKAEVY